MRTDVELNAIGEPLVLHCRQSDDYLPHPAACRVTGLAPDALGEGALPEYRFIETIRRLARGAGHLLGRLQQRPFR